ncbi:MAG TPA: hypothetical protein VK335_25655 [Bryobacteraceae bacterium]|nr:hypothetical protein [Bryobacteraceae bacterium]
MEQPHKSDPLAEIAKRIEEDDSAAYAQFVKEMQESEDRQVPILRFLGERFEIRAHYNSFLVRNYEAIPKWYEPYLHEVRNGIIQEAEKLLSKWPDLVAQGFREKLAANLLGRLHHWKPAAMKRARELGVSPSANSGEVATSGNRTVGVGNHESKQRRALVNSYIDEVFRETKKHITRKDIWQSARYKTRTEFERWERADRRATKTSNERFTRLLTVEKPHLK